MRKMKESGIDWLDTIPENWKVDKFKNGFSFGKGLNITKENLTLTGTKVISYGQIHSKLNKTTGIDDSLYRFVSDDYVETSPAALVSKGDIIFADTSEDYAGIGNCVHIDIDDTIFAGYHTVIAHPEESENSKYLSYLFLTDCWRSQIRSSVSGIKVFSITQKILKQLSIILPPVEEQNKITAFLDDKCARLDDIIAKQHQVIDKLNEYKSSFVSKAITKGLDSTADLKESNVEWIGEIPKHWTPIKIKYASKIMRGRFNHRPRNDPAYYNGKYPFVQTGDVANANKYINTYSQTLNDLGYSVSKEFPKGSICMTIAANVGDVAVLNFTACFPDSVVGFVPCEKTYWNYLYYALKSMKKQLLRNAIISTQLNLNIEIIKEEFIPFPPMEEQKQIADYLDKKCAAIDDSIAKRQQLIEKLTEYKKSLIFEVVTGKKEV